MDCLTVMEFDEIQAESRENVLFLLCRYERQCLWCLGDESPSDDARCNLSSRLDFFQRHITEIHAPHFQPGGRCQRPKCATVEFQGVQHLKNHGVKRVECSNRLSIVLLYSFLFLLATFRHLRNYEFPINPSRE